MGMAQEPSIYNAKTSKLFENSDGWEDRNPSWFKELLCQVQKLLLCNDPLNFM